MAYDSIGLQRATDRLSRRKTDWDGTMERRRRALFQEVPELSEIDRQLRKTMVEAMASCLRSGEDPRPALQKVRTRNLSLQERQTNILREHGLGPDALNQTHLCQLCGDKGWQAGKMCDCLRTLYIEEELNLLRACVDIDQQTFETFSLDWYATVLQSGHTLTARDNMELVRDMCRMYAEHFGSFSTRNLFLIGGPGLGKTFLCACIARTVAEKGFWVIYVTASELFSAFYNRRRSPGGEDERQVRRYLSCDLLVLDDLGSEWTMPSTQAALYTVVNDRLRENRCTVISCNLGGKEPSEIYSEQTASRIGEYRMLKFFGEDIRTLRKKTRETTKDCFSRKFGV